VWNKIDRLKPSQREVLKARARSLAPPAVLLSAVTGEGVPDLLQTIERELMGGRPTVTVELQLDQLGAAPWLYENTEVLERSDDPATGRARLKVRLQEKRLALFRAWAERERVPVAVAGARQRLASGAAG
jgi:GTP-binding protein HflX